MYIDSHCHLNFGAFSKDWQEVTDDCVKAGVEKMIVVGADLETSQKAIEICQKHPALFAAVGVHPHHASGEFDVEKLKQLAQNKKVVAIGETGVDYHVYQKSKYPSTALRINPEMKNRQKIIFGQQIQLAKTLKLPLIIHNREAGEDALDVLEHFCKDDGIYPAGVFHCISGSKKLLQKILALDFYVGVDANITYSQEVQTLVADSPLEKILLETDAPYLTPSRDGSRNTPQSVKMVAQEIARVKHLPENLVIKQTSTNAQRLFKL
ncbi:TatD family hydrolase [Patescibacteria group bacterium]|nr:TatD family hydrolase [Patescibacteria group bacterium]